MKEINKNSHSHNNNVNNNGKTKSITIPVDLHKEIKVQASKNSMLLKDYIEFVLKSGLAIIKNAENIQE